MKVLAITSRTITLELENDLPYYAQKKFDVFLNSKFLYKEERNVFTIFDLEPNTLYVIDVLDEKLKIKTNPESMLLNVKDFNALGDGVSDDTVKIQAAIACAKPDACIYFPEGIYLVSALFLKSDLTIYLSKNAKLIAKYNRNDIPVLPGGYNDYDYGSWEGSITSTFSSIITAIDCKNLIIAGLGEIDSQAYLGDWYNNHHDKRIAWRGFGMYFKDCENVTVIGTYIHDTPAWNIHPFFSKHLKFLNMRIENPTDKSTTDGIDPDCCDDVLIAGCYFKVGDDCIALKSGTFELAKKFNRPTTNITIRNNLMTEGHGGVVFGSESSSGISNVIIEKCLFQNTDRGFRIKTRRGRGRVGTIDNVSFSNIYMENVLTPFVINMFYNMGPAGGHEEYVWTEEKLPITEKTPYVGAFSFENITCLGCSYAAGVFLGLPEEPIKGIGFKNVKFSFNGDAEAGYPVMIEKKFKALKRGLVCYNVDKVELEEVSFEGIIGDELLRLKSIKDGDLE